MNANTQGILTELHKTRSVLIAKRGRVEDELKLIMSEKDAIDKQVSSLDVVISIYDDNLVAHPAEESAGDGEKETLPDSVTDAANQIEDSGKTPDMPETVFELNGHSSATKNKTGMRQAVRDNLSDLPSLFTKEDIENLLFREMPEKKGQINENTMSSLIRSLTDDNLIEVEVPATGRKKQIYKKVI